MFPWLSLLLGVALAGHCPLSELVQPEVDLVFSYCEYFFSEHELAAHPNRPRYVCPLMRTKLANCTLGLCPLREENLQSLVESMSWRPYQTAICELSLSKSAQKPYGMNLLFFGSSFTAGSMTSGQCCTSYLSEPSKCDKYRREGEDYYCAWPGFFRRWLEKLFPRADIRTTNFGLSGYSSASTAYSLAHFLHNYTITRRDIIFLDHSITDTILTSDAHHHVVERGLETLIRALYTMSVDGLPTIIIIDQWPHNEKSHSKTTSDIYVEIAKHYEIPIWSPKKVLHSEFAEKNQYHFVSVLLKKFGMHPDWSYHFFMADLISLGFARAIEECDHTVEKTYAGVPEPLFSTDSLIEDGICDPTQPLLLDVYPESKFTPSDLKAFESNLSTWTTYIDRHNVAGFIINNNAKNHVLSIPLNYDLTETNVLTHVLKIRYQSTYFNAGKFQVAICGQPLDFDIDALNINHKSKKMSIPAVKTIGGYAFSGCYDAPEEMHQIAIIYRPYFGADGVDHGFPRGHEKVKILSIEVCHQFA